MAIKRIVPDMKIKSINKIFNQVELKLGRVVAFFILLLFYWLSFFVKAISWMHAFDKADKLFEVLMYIIFIIAILLGSSVILKTNYYSNKKFIIILIDYAIMILIAYTYFKGHIDIYFVLESLFVLCCSSFFIIKYMTRIWKQRLKSTLNMESDYMRSKFKDISILFLLLGIHLYVLFDFSQYNEQVGRITHIVSKRESKGIYYISIPDENEDEEDTVNVNCSKAVYNKLIVDKNVLYSMEYRRYKLNNSLGILESIDDDIVDNRR